ncbi:MAG: ABC transporter ATP-binding protein [Burkholderiaceae bacterium]|nr:MAG: ABC transporter ATP-binding protein [Burkholderiaceae bacterium]
MVLLDVSGLSKHYGGLYAVHDVSLQVEEARIVGVIGPNGAGKSTLFSLIAGAVRTDSGHVVFAGEDVTKMRPYQICERGLARTFQVAKPFLDLTVLENVTIAALVRKPNVHAAIDKAESVLKFVGLAHRIRAESRTLGTADRKRLELARALATEPRLLLLDEVMAGLTSIETRQAVDLVREIRDKGVTVLLVEHVMQAVMALCEEILVLHEGKLLAKGSPAEIAAHPAVIEAYLGKGYAHA